jgi:DNA-binding transcriptional MerR regulator
MSRLETDVTLAEIAEAAGVPPRQIRFMIAEGFVPAATGTGRGADAYGEEHLAKVRRYMTLHGLGMKPSAIKVLMEFDEAIPIFQQAGVEVRVDPSVDPQSIDVNQALKAIAQALRMYVSKG